MSNRVRAAAVVLAVLICVPQAAEAQYGRPYGAGDCRQPGLAHQLCTCTTYKPVVQTRYREENVISYRDRRETVVRHEPQYECVPTTEYEDVVVDEGSYQSVWVPKPVVRTVAHTVYESRLSYRPVSYEVTRRVPEISTRLVPERTVRYVPDQRTVAVVPADDYSHCRRVGGPCGLSSRTERIRCASIPRPDDVLCGRLAYDDDGTRSHPRRYRRSARSYDSDWLEDNPAIRVTTARSVKSPTAATVWQTLR